jgi:hypothetical protein
VSAYQIYELLCDDEGCLSTFNGAEITAFATRAKAATQGWVHTRVPSKTASNLTAYRAVDYCPTHAKEHTDA